MTLCRCGIELRPVTNGCGVGMGHVSPTTYRHYPRLATPAAADRLSGAGTRRRGSSDVGTSDGVSGSGPADGLGAVGRAASSFAPGRGRGVPRPGTAVR